MTDLGFRNFQLLQEKFAHIKNFNYLCACNPIYRFADIL